MKKLSEVVPSRSSPSMQETLRSPASIERAMRVWTQLAEIFGNAFYREYSDAPTALWRQAIEKLTDQQLGNGLAKLANDGLSFPANLSQFVVACKTIRRTAYWDVKQLPPPTEDELKLNAEKAWDHMERLAGKKLRPDSEPL